MELIRRTAPYDATAVRKLLEDTFGYEEVLVEAPQLDGREIAANRDIVWEAWEGDLLIGTIHATIPLKAPHLCPLLLRFVLTKNEQARHCFEKHAYL